MIKRQVFSRLIFVIMVHSRNLMEKLNLVLERF